MRRRVAGDKLRLIVIWAQRHEPVLAAAPTTRIREFAELCEFYRIPFAMIGSDELVYRKADADALQLVLKRLGVGEPEFEPTHSNEQESALPDMQALFEDAELGERYPQWAEYMQECALAKSPERTDVPGNPNYVRGDRALLEERLALAKDSLGKKA